MEAENMAALVVESTALIQYLRGEENTLLELGLEAMALQLPPLVYTELMGNPIHAKERASIEQLFQKIPLCEVDRGHFERSAKLKAALEARGMHLSARDAHIVQCALDQDALLLTKDPFFAELTKYCGVKVQL